MRRGWGGWVGCLYILPLHSLIRTKHLRDKAHPKNSSQQKFKHFLKHFFPQTRLTNIADVLCTKRAENKKNWKRGHCNTRERIIYLAPDTLPTEGQNSSVLRWVLVWDRIYQTKKVVTHGLSREIKQKQLVFVVTMDLSRHPGVLFTLLNLVDSLPLIYRGQLGSYSGGKITVCFFWWSSQN